MAKKGKKKLSKAELHASRVKSGKKVARIMKARKAEAEAEGKKPRKASKPKAAKKPRAAAKPKTAAKRKPAKKGGKKRKSSVSKRVTARSASKGTSHKTDVNVSVRTAAEPKRKPAKRKGGKGKGKRRAREENPIPMGGGMDFAIGLGAVVLGGVTWSLGQRAAATHALTLGTADSSGNQTVSDTPDQTKMQIYNSEAVALPIWKSWQRLLAAGLTIAAPLGISAIVKSAGAKSFWQLAGFSAITLTAVKAADDGVSKLAGTSKFALRMYAPELASQNRQMQAYPQGTPGTGTLNPSSLLTMSTPAGAPAGTAPTKQQTVTFAGPPPPPPGLGNTPPHPHGSAGTGVTREQIEQSRIRHIHGIPGFNPFSPES